MAQILVRQIDDQTIARLKARAKRNARSTEAEVRQIIQEAVARPQPGRPLSSFIGAGASATSFKSNEEIVAHVRALRDEWDD
jgi:plasmid stability protein